MPINQNLPYRLKPNLGASWSPIVANTWYNQELEGDLIIYAVQVAQTHTEAGNEDLEIRITIDGETYATLTIALAASGDYHGIVFNIPNDAITDVGAGTVVFFMQSSNFEHPLQCEKIKIELRQTSAVGTNPTLYMNVFYGRKDVQ